ncbi:MAG: hypothetical protein IJ760_05120 [Bacteroidales bacterium]|nr:hypothetical protein [Bacteroidales bacterium]
MDLTSLRGKVHIICIDPPFDSKADYRTKRTLTCGDISQKPTTLVMCKRIIDQEGNPFSYQAIGDCQKEMVHNSKRFRNIGNLSQGGVQLFGVLHFMSDQVDALCIGAPDTTDETILMTSQAADLRRDNGRIVGTFVLHGEPLSGGFPNAVIALLSMASLVLGVRQFATLRAADRDGWRLLPPVCSRGWSPGCGEQSGE